MAKTFRNDAAATKRRAPVSSEILDRQPPCNVEAEHCVLGSILIHPDVCDDITLILRPEDFYDDANALLYRHMLGLHEGGKKIDITLLVDALQKKGDYDTIGGPTHLARVTNAVPNAAHAVYYANIVRTKSTFRSLINASTEILRDAYDEQGEAEDMLGQAEQKIFEILERRGGNHVAEIKDVLHEAMERLEKRRRGEHTEGTVFTGFSELDTMTGGLHNGELIVLAARPSMGKTALAMNVAETIAIDQDIPVLFMSLEMSAMELVDRLLSSKSRVENHRMRNGTLRQDDMEKLIDASSQIYGKPLFVDDAPGRRVVEIAAAARRIKRKQGRLGLIVIDYLQLIEPDNPSDPRQEQVAKMSRRLKAVAKELQVPILCLAQLNRQAESSAGNLPRLSHLRESGAIEQDADVVMFVHREEYYMSNEERERKKAEGDPVIGAAQIIIAKQRAGPTGEANLIFQNKFMRFEDRAPERHNEFDDYNEHAQ
jgi:replicative DNA helicase